MNRGNAVVTAIKRVATGRPSADPETARRAAETQDRVCQLIEITAKDGDYRKGLPAAARHLSPQEAVIIADLEEHGLQVPQLRDILRGGHVIVDDIELYTAWRFPEVSHLRISSHHKDIDKKKYPDFGMRGVVVREKLHGRTQTGTWVQLEKTPAAFGNGKKLPSLDDLRHLGDYFIYKITRSNVGPWGLSRVTEKRPIYLSPDLALPVSLAPEVAGQLTASLHQIEKDDDTTSASTDLARKFPPPDRENPSCELGQALTGRGGRGLFGNSELGSAVTTASVTAEMLQPPPPPAPTWIPKAEAAKEEQ